jgi:hypothetical protein
MPRSAIFIFVLPGEHHQEQMTAGAGHDGGGGVLVCGDARMLGGIAYGGKLRESCL